MTETQILEKANELRSQVELHKSFLAADPTGKNAQDIEPMIAETLGELKSAGYQPQNGDDAEGEKIMSTAEQLLAPAAKQSSTGNIRVKRPSERYRSEKQTGKHIKTGREVSLGYKAGVAQTASEAELAKAGAILKMSAHKSGVINVDIDEHTRELFAETVNHDVWCGKVGSEHVKHLTGERLKTLLNDSTSGGDELVPVWFDDMIISFPMLHGELFPFTTIREVPRGATVEGASIGNPSVVWNDTEGSAATVFNTASLVGELNTTIFPVATFIEVGRDFMSDSPVEVGQELVENITQAMLSDLDNQIANGDGTTEPLGIFNTSGTTIVSSANGTSGPWTVGDIEQLAFGVAKQYRHSNLRPLFVMNDTTYRRARGVKVGTSDARRVFGMDHQSYQLLEYGVKIENNIPDNDAAFVAMAKYRLYRRAGFQIQWSDGGEALMLKNTALLAVRGRYGGRMMDGSAVAEINDAPIVNS